jgi:hypothetical protein
MALSRSPLPAAASTAPEPREIGFAAVAAVEGGYELGRHQLTAMVAAGFSGLFS